MAKLRRRNTLIGLGTIVFGTSGFIVSGAFSIGSEGSRGAEWIQVASADQEVSPAVGEEQQDVEDDDGDSDDDDDPDDDGDDGDDGDADTDDDGTDDSDEDDEDDEDDDEETPSEETPDESTPEATPEQTPEATPEPTPEATPEPTPDEETPGGGGEGGGGSPTETPDETPTPTETPTETPDETTRVQVVTDPDNDGNLVNQGAATWQGQMAATETVVGDENGFFEAFSVANANRNAVSRAGLVDERGYPREDENERLAFLVANVGNPETPGQGGQPVDLVVALLDGSEVMGSTEQVNLPYRVVNPGGGTVETGRDLLETTVRLPVGQVIEVVIEIDSRDGTADAERVDTMLFEAVDTDA